MSKPIRSADVAVIGGGVIGLAVAWELAHRGIDVVLLERERIGGGTSHVAAGMLAPTSEANPNERELLGLELRSAALYPDWITRLTDAVGDGVGYLPCGTLLAARDRDEAEALDRQLELRRALGLPVRRLLPSEARELEPGLAPSLRGAALAPDDHAIDPRALCAALARALVLAGGELREHSPVALRIDGDAVTGVQLGDGRMLAAGHTVIATGVWTGTLHLPPAAQIPVRAVKGQILRCHDPAGPGLLGRVLRYGSGYVVPRGDGRYVIGATMEERGLDTTVTAGAVFELLRDANELLPAVDQLVIDELGAGVRPGTPDNAPVIGPGALDGLLWAVGHYRHGVLLAPVTAQLIAGALDGDPAPAEFSAERFTAAVTA